jgi:hypothetical protein
MLPIPIENFTPVALDGDDASGQALRTKFDTHLAQWRQDIIDMFKLMDPVRCPTLFLDTLGHWVRAGLRNSDSDTTKRIKTATAISRHKEGGVWDTEVKPLIDSITGLDAVIFRAIDTADWIGMSGESSEPDYYWATGGVDGIDDNLGLDGIGAGDEIEIQGNIYIDLGGTAGNPTAAVIAQVVEEIELEAYFAYYILYLGYVNVSGQFIVYAGGTI